MSFYDWNLFHIDPYKCAIKHFFKCVHRSRVLISSITYYITVSFSQKSKLDFFSLFENCVNLGERCGTIFKSSQEYV